MEQGFLNRSSKASKKNGGESRKKGALLSDLASKVKNIDGKMLGKDGKPLKAYRCVNAIQTSMDKANGVVDPMETKNDNSEVGGMKPALFDTEINHAAVGITSEESPITMLDVGTENPGSKPLAPTVNLTEREDVIDLTVADVFIPQEEVNMISARFENSLYGYFIGKRHAFLAVQNYVKTVWAKYGFKHVMLHQGFFMFQFSTKEGMENALNQGPWRIRSVPLILNFWNPNSELKKEDIKMIPVWVKLFNVHIVAYSKVGLNLITSKLGRLIMLDAHTSNMCLNSWGMSSYARALVEISTDNEFVESLVVVVPLDKGKGHRMASIKVEFESRPPRCTLCKNFDHVDEECPKKGKEEIRNTNMDGGFVHVKRKTNVVNQALKLKHIEGLRLSKAKPKLVYKRVDKSNSNLETTSKPKENAPHTTTKGVDMASEKPSVSSKEMNDESSRHTNENVKSNFFKDDIDLGQLRSNMNKLVEEDKVIDINTDVAKSVVAEGMTKDKGNLWERFKEAKEAATSKPRSSNNIEDDSDEDEVYMPDEFTLKFISSTGGELTMEDDDLDCYDGYEAQIYDVPWNLQKFCDQYDVLLNSRVRK
ncbi:zinc knuckle CX2CX4HX4C containing protein [Tanacetum coccineum]